MPTSTCDMCHRERPIEDVVICASCEEVVCAACLLDTTCLLADGGDHTVSRTCTECGGIGEVWIDESSIYEPCEACDGDGCVLVDPQSLRSVVAVREAAQ